MGTRQSYEASCLRLQPSYLEPGDVPPVPDHLPQYDDEEPLGVNFFRTAIDGEDLSNLTLPRTFFGRSEISKVSFQNTDFSESNLSLNEFTHVDFSSALLTQSDMRGSVFSNTSFESADLRASDLRRSSFENCIFTDALMAGTVLTIAQGNILPLSDRQRAEIAWADADGDEPGGG
ncbi:pentapeptide repeat-containing protein [Xanthomonas sp. CFBP 8703]|uniref:Pentapeptide repeat-containing protein n=1 Tax=Xanthomonas bonasiae TaxID=2810351 RepID=A0ABS3B817_9XANT|nr:pentapeptide repeat-containing protein [Xanthomonas bonasiae]MBN6104752.1 pentapeptide repeat-containing protein [Xanthomonas bonasiae]